MIKSFNLYLVLSQEYSDKPVREIANEAIAGGVDIVQMREKNMSHQELIELGNELRELCHENDVKFIVNDNPFFAKEVNADGVHLGQEDMRKYYIAEAREILGEDKIIGVSTHSVSQFEHANKIGCDYIAFGPIFETQTKDYHIGMKDISKVLKIAQKPVIFIGGINLSNVDEVLSKGAENIAVIRAITRAKNVSLTARSLKIKIVGANPDAYSDK
ncbi:MAG: thiamine phosphate synthase [Candidatus Omnitrophica bacterium]|nr:thiamine phosphate synthase [Candidatus Omnitrophota bacterium]